MTMREHDAMDDLPYFEGATFEAGDGIFVGADGIGQIVRRPADYAAQAAAGTPYRLELDATGVWVWVARPTRIEALVEDGDGVLLFDDTTGDVLYEG